MTRGRPLKYQTAEERDSAKKLATRLRQKRHRLKLQSWAAEARYHREMAAQQEPEPYELEEMGEHPKHVQLQMLRQRALRDQQRRIVEVVK